MSLEERYWFYTDRKGPDECWNWRGTIDRKGYGEITNGGRGNGIARAHRIAYEIAKGPIPGGLVIDHLCRNRRCVNPAHLEAVTVGENTRRGLAHIRQSAIAASRTHCKNGHPWTIEGTRTSPSGKRICKACQRDYQRKHRATKCLMNKKHDQEQ